jgi:predicted nucleic acid-binding protein
MIVVSNTAPLNYLVLINQVEILAQLFGAVVIPEAVFRELSSRDAPEQVRAWSASPPAWLQVQRHSLPADPALRKLHAGEREAIQLAEELKALMLRGRGVV